MDKFGVIFGYMDLHGPRFCSIFSILGGQNKNTVQDFTAFTCNGRGMRGDGKVENEVFFHLENFEHNIYI